jgi:hypothetical protein
LGARHKPETLAALSAKMSIVMKDPDVRRKISEGTKAGLKNASGSIPELRELRTIWLRAPPAVRKRFLSEILDAACGETTQPGVAR